MGGRIELYEAGGNRWEDAFEDDGDDGAPRGGRRPAKLSILHDGGSFVVVDKPAGVATVPERIRRDAPTVIELVDRAWSRDDRSEPPVVVHRLDRDTSGCLVMARDRATAKTLMTRFRKRDVRKTYLALTTGAPQPPEGTVDFRIAPDRKRPGAMWMPRKGGKPCHDAYETLEAFRGVSLVRVSPRSGRTHEVRMALSNLGTPCAIDPLYGSDAPLLLSRWKANYRTGRGRAERPLIDRLTLHAESIAFPPPGVEPEDEDGWLRVEAPLPRDLSATLRQLRRHAAPGTL